MYDWKMPWKNPVLPTCAGTVQILLFMHSGLQKCLKKHTKKNGPMACLVAQLDVCPPSIQVVVGMILRSDKTFFPGHWS